MNKTYFKIVFTLFTLIIYTSFINAQVQEEKLRQPLTSKIDSVLLNTYEKLGNYYNTNLGKGDSAIFYGHKIVALSKKVNDDNYKTKGYSLIGLGYATNQDYKSAEIHLLNGLESAKTTNNKEQLAILYNRLGGTYQNLDKLPLALKYLLQAITYSKEIKNFKVLALSYYSISIIYALQGQTQKQLEYLSKSLNIVNNEDALPPLNKSLILGTASQQFSVVSNKEGFETYQDSSLIYARRALEISEKYNLSQRIPSDLIVVSYNYITRGDTVNSLKYAEKALGYTQSMREDTKYNLFSTLIEINKTKKDKKECYAYIDSLNNLSIKKRPQYGMLISKSSHEVYKFFNDHDLAYSALDEYFEIEKKIKVTEQNETINKLEAQYQTQLKDAEIKRLTVLLIIAVAFIILGLLIFNIIRLRKSKNKNLALTEAIKQQLALEKKLMNVRNNIAQDFHDDLGNKLARISFLSRLVEDELSEADNKIKSKVKQVKEDTVSLYVGTKDFIFSLKPNSDYLEEVVTYLSDFGEDYFNETNIQFILDKHINQNKKLPHYWSKQLIFIFKEAMTNAFKYSNCNMLTLKFQYSDNLLTISCIDNGIGIIEEDLNSKNGLLNMKKRAEKIGCELKILTKQNQGTTIKFIGKTLQNEV